MSQLSKTEVALSWLRVGVFLDKSRSPNGAGFRLKLHDKNPDAPLSPFYLNFRLLQSSPIVLSDTAMLMIETTKDLDYELISPVPHAATPLATMISHHSGIPMITPREAKTHGVGAKIDGVYKPGQRVAVFDDLITSGASILETIKVLEAAGLVIAGVGVLVDRQQSGEGVLANDGYAVRVAFTISRLLKLFLDNECISREVYYEINEYLFQ